MNVKSWLPAVALLALVSLTACAGGGGGGGKPPAQQAPEPQQKAGSTEKSQTPISKGVAAMRTQMGDLRTAIDANDSAKAQKAAKALDDAWDKFEDQVKAKDKDLYARIEDPLHAAIAGVKATPLDKKALNAQLDKLDTLLDEANGMKPAGGTDIKVVDLPTGVAAMRYYLGTLKSAVTADDTAHAQVYARAMDDTWDKFEGFLKKQDKDAYSKSEDAIHAIMAGVKQTPLDKKSLTDQITKLDGILAGLTTK